MIRNSGLRRAATADDPLFGAGSMRADGRKPNPMYLFDVKSPGESRYPWDHYRLVRAVPAKQAFRPVDSSNCSMLQHLSKG